MPAKKHNEEWRELVFQVAEDHPTWGPGRVSVAISQHPTRPGLADAEDGVSLPSERTIGRWLREFRALDEQARLPYRTYSWPEAMRRGALPWDAAAALFDLAQSGQSVTIRKAQWFWRVTLARPDAPIDNRDKLARYLAAADLLPEDARMATYETVEAAMFYAPWQSEEHQRLYYEAIGRGDVKLLSLALTADTTIDEAIAALDEQQAGMGTSMRSLFEAWAEHPELSRTEALDAQIEAGSKKGDTP